MTVGHAGASLLRRMEDTDQQDSTKRPSSSKAVFTPIQQLAHKTKGDKIHIRQVEKLPWCLKGAAFLNSGVY